MTAIRQEVTVQANGLIEVRSPELHEGDIAEVTVRVKAVPAKSEDGNKPSWRDFIGAFGSGGGSSDNESIDRDLADSYGDNHDPQK